MWLAVGKAKIKIAKIVNFDRIAKINALENIKIYSSVGYKNYKIKPDDASTEYKRLKHIWPMMPQTITLEIIWKCVKSS